MCRKSDNNIYKNMNNVLDCEHKLDVVTVRFVIF